MNIQSYGPFANKILVNPDTPPALANHKTSFAEMLKSYATDMNHDVKAANAQAETLAVTGEGNMSETLLAVKQADLSFQLMLSARNKLVDAYREVIRMQV